MAHFHFVYILTSVSNPERQYTGLTSKLTAQLTAHNRGRVRPTAGDRPWRIETAVAFTSREKAETFRNHLRTESGRAVAELLL
jgi:predicted GIY-YIG superfamily endonuclease